MLSTNIILMKQNLNELLKINGPFYKAAYDAFYNTNNKEISSDSQIDSDFDSIIKEAEIKRLKLLKDDSEKFAKEFCEGLKNGGFMNSLADEIDKHIKSALITINVPVLPPTLATASGPVTGSLIISEATGAKIDIN